MLVAVLFVVLSAQEPEALPWVWRDSVEWMIDGQSTLADGRPVCWNTWRAPVDADVHVWSEGAAGLELHVEVGDDDVLIVADEGGGDCHHEVVSIAADDMLRIGVVAPAAAPAGASVLAGRIHLCASNTQDVHVAAARRARGALAAAEWLEWLALDVIQRELIRGATVELLALDGVRTSGKCVSALARLGHRLFATQQHVLGFEVDSLVLAFDLDTRPPDHATVISSRRSLAGSCALLGDRERELVQRRAILESLRRARPDDFAAIVRALDTLAYALCRTGDHHDARRVYEELLSHLERTVDADPLTIVRCRADLGAVCEDLEDYAAAMLHLEAAFETAEALGTVEAWRVTEMRIDLGDAYQGFGAFEQAKALRTIVLANALSEPTIDVADVRQARTRLADSLASIGEFEAAIELRQAVLAALGGSESDELVLHARADLADTLERAGHFDEGLELRRAVLAALEEQLDASDERVIHARLKLGRSHSRAGQSREALALQSILLDDLERAGRSGTRLHFAALVDLASSQANNGDLEAAFATGTRVIAILEANPVRDDAEIAMQWVAQAELLSGLGRSAEAVSVLEANVASIAAHYGSDHPRHQQTLMSLARALFDVGDFSRARAMYEQLVERRRAAGSLESAAGAALLSNYAFLLTSVGDHDRACVLREEALRINLLTQAPGDVDVFVARVNLANHHVHSMPADVVWAEFEALLAECDRQFPSGHALRASVQVIAGMAARKAGEFEVSKHLLSEAVELRSATLDALSLDLADARSQLARTLRVMGEREAARTLFEHVLATMEASTAEPVRERVLARNDVLVALLESNETERAVARAREQVADLREALPRLAKGTSSRETRAVARLLVSNLDEIDLVALTTDDAALWRDSFELAETARAIGVRPPALAVSENVDAARRALNDARDRLEQIVSGASADEDATTLARRIADASFERDEADNRLHTLLPEVDRTVTVERVAASLQPDSVVVAYLVVNDITLDENTQRFDARRSAVIAHLVRPDGHFERVALGPLRPIRESVEAWRAEIGAAQARGLGLAAPASNAGAELQRALLAPILARLPADVRRIYVCSDSVVHLVPLDALPLDGGVVGERYQFVNVTSLADLGHTERPDASGTGALFLGGPDFDANSVVALATTTRGARSPSNQYAPLLQARLEVQTLATLYEVALGSPAELLVGRAATREALFAAADGKRFVHVATHGWFDPDVAAQTDSDASNDDKSSTTSVDDAAIDFAPATLCGLALAGANQPRDDLGRATGIVTAEALASLDLSACDLAVLSACETNVGVRRAGETLQSLRAALHSAGARTSITSLWKVDDAATRRLFELVYTNLWLENLGPADALWQAKMALRSEGHPTRDWAGWVLTGDAD